MAISNIASTIDILPTIADIIDDPKTENKIDGVSILPLLKNIPNSNPRDKLFYYNNENLIAVRKMNGNSFSLINIGHTKMLSQNESISRSIWKRESRFRAV